MGVSGTKLPSPKSVFTKLWMWRFGLFTCTTSTVATLRLLVSTVVTGAAGLALMTSGGVYAMPVTAWFFPSQALIHACEGV